MSPETAQFAKFTIAPGSSIEEAAQKIEDNDYGTLIVVDGGDNRVVGTLTDGDLRKAFLNRRLSVTPVRDIMNTHFLSVKVGEQTAAQALFRERFYLKLIPVVDDDGLLKSVIQRD